MFKISLMIIHEKIFQKTALYEGQAHILSFLPDETCDEVCFCGRSNVGKSSLINALFFGQKLARTSNTPGRTQALHFYRLQTESFDIRFADIPGHGYAKASKKDVYRWQCLIGDYLLSRRRLRKVIFLIDCRVGLKKADYDTLDIIARAGIACQPVVTKIDKLSRINQHDAYAKIKEQLTPYAFVANTILPVSATKNYGMTELRKYFLKMIDS